MTFLGSSEASGSIARRAAAVKLAIFDVDGVMTDGKLYLSADGSETKSMHVRDGLGLKRLTAAGVAIAVISGRPSASVAARLSDLGITEIHMGCEDKAACLARLRTARRLGDEQIAVMGDDFPDLAIMQQSGLALSVADAMPEVRAASHWVSTLPGGHGAVREACEMLIAAIEGG